MFSVANTPWLGRLGSLAQLQSLTLSDVEASGAQLPPLPALISLLVSCVASQLHIRLADYPALVEAYLAGTIQLQGAVSCQALKRLELHRETYGPVHFGPLPALRCLKLFICAEAPDSSGGQEAAAAVSIAGATQLQVRAGMKPTSALLRMLSGFWALLSKYCCASHAMPCHAMLCRGAPR